MKKILNPVLLTCSLVLASCSYQQKAIEPFSEESREILEAKVDFETSILQSIPTFDAKHEISKRNRGHKQLKWEDAIFKYLSFGKVIIVPIAAPPNDYFIQYQTGERLKLSNMHNLLIYQNQEGERVFEVVTIIPDDEYVIKTEDSKQFSGIIIVEDWWGNFIKGYSEQGGFTKTIEPDHDNAQAYVLPDGCTTIDWYTCTSTNGGVSFTCNYDYSESYCSQSSGDSGAFIDYYYTSGGSGSSYSYYGAYILDQVKGRLCGSYSFTSVGNSYTATFNGLGIYAENRNASQFINVELFSTCVTVPSYGINSSTVSSLFKEAYNLSTHDIMAGLNAGLIAPTHSAIRQAFVNSIKSHLAVMSPGAAFSTSPCLGSVATNTASYC